MNWKKFDDQMPPYGTFLLARALDEDSPIYMIARHVTVGDESYIRICKPFGWELLPEGDYATCAWCAIEEPAMLKRYRQPRWIEDRPHHWRCSVCGTMQGEAHKVMYYCPRCGARMA